MAVLKTPTLMFSKSFGPLGNQKRQNVREFTVAAKGGKDEKLQLYMGCRGRDH